jgi:hypothetical protein
MKASTILCLGLIAACGAGPALAARQGDYVGFSRLFQQRSAVSDREGEQERAAPGRETRGAGETERSRMNPDERRQLRRDIQDAGRDIYRPVPQNGRDRRRSERR